MKDFAAEDFIEKKSESDQPLAKNGLKPTMQKLRAKVSSLSWSQMEKPTKKNIKT